MKVPLQKYQNGEVQQNIDLKLSAFLHSYFICCFGDSSIVLLPLFQKKTGKTLRVPTTDYKHVFLEHLSRCSLS